MTMLNIQLGVQVGVLICIEQVRGIVAESVCFFD